MATFLIILSIILFACAVIMGNRTQNKSNKPIANKSDEPVKQHQSVDFDDLTNYVYIDTETSSLEVDRGEVLQLSAIKIQNINGDQCTLSTFNEYIKPSEDIRIDPMSMKVNGISLAKCQCPKTKAFQDFLDFCDGKIVCGYNVDFDIRMIDDDMKKEGFNLFDHISYTKDVLEEARNAMLPTPNNKLVTVSKYLGFKCDKYHNAIFDCLATMYVDHQLSHNGGLSINYEEVINALSKDYEDVCQVNDDKFKEFFNGKNVCISGDFENISRKYLEEKIVECGGIVKSGMSRRVDIFISGYNVNPTTKEKKYDELIGLGWNKITKYNEKELLEKIG